MENTEKNIYADVVPRFPEHLQETMSKLPLETQQRLYVDIFKPLDFYELLFEYFKEKDRAQNSSDNEDKRWMLLQKGTLNLCNEKFARERERERERECVSEHGSLFLWPISLYTNS